MKSYRFLFLAFLVVAHNFVSHSRYTRQSSYCLDSHVCFLLAALTMTELSRLSAGLGGIPAPVTAALAALHVHTPVNLMAWGPDAATQAAVAASGSSLASLAAAMHVADASFDAGDGQHMAGLSNLVVVACVNCDRSAQRLGELALGSSASASSSDQEKKKNDAYVRSAYGRVGTMLMIFPLPSLMLPSATVLQMSNSLEAGQLHSSVFRLDASSVFSQVEETRTVLSGGFSLLASDGSQQTHGREPACVGEVLLQAGLSRAPGARCRWNAGACPQHGEPGSL